MRLLDTMVPGTTKIALALIYIGWATGFIIRNTPIIDGHPVFFLFDDGMISMRYAANLLAGHGLVWNPGDYVEGYTNPLWTLIMAAAIAAFGTATAPLIIQSFGLLLGLGTCAFGAQAAIELSAVMGAPSGRRPAARIVHPTYTLAFLLIATTYPITFWSLTGMEVSLIACLTALATLIAIRVFTHDIPSRRGLAFLYLIGTVLYFTRPDAPLNVVPVLLATSWIGWARDRRSTLLTSLACLAGAACLAAIHLLWRHAYYGTMVPNTYTLKVEGYGAYMRWRNGLHFLRKFALSYFPIVGLQLYLLVRWRGSALVLAIGGTLPLALFYQVQVGGDPWPYWRQLAPALGLSSVLIAAAAGYFLAESPLARLRRWGVSLAAVAIVLLADSRFLGEMSFVKPAYGIDYMNYVARVGLELRRILRPDATVMAFWAGELPYLWGGKAIDPLGKSDSYIAHLPPHTTPNWDGMAGVPGHAKYDLKRSVLEQRPDYIQFAIWGDDNVTADIADTYVLAETNGLALCLLKDSPRVRWEMVRIVGPCVN